MLTAGGIPCLLALILAGPSSAEWRVVNLSANTKIMPNPWASPCDPAVWFQDRVQERGEPIVDAQCGDLRRDGVVRMYAYLGQSHQYIELENTNEGPHTVKDVFNAKTFAPRVTFGLGSNAPKPSIFMSEGVRVRELFWDGTRWISKLIESSYEHIPRALIADDLRRDGKRHLFAECGRWLIDYSLQGNQWTASKYQIRSESKYSKTTRGAVGAMPGAGRGIAVWTDTASEFIAWFPDKPTRRSLKQQLQEIISPKHVK